MLLAASATASMRLTTTAAVGGRLLGAALLLWGDRVIGWGDRGGDGTRGV